MPFELTHQIYEVEPASLSLADFLKSQAVNMYGAAWERVVTLRDLLHGVPICEGGHPHNNSFACWRLDHRESVLKALADGRLDVEGVQDYLEPCLICGAATMMQYGHDEGCMEVATPWPTLAELRAHRGTA